MRRKKALNNLISSFLLEIVVIINGFLVPKIIISHFGSDVNGLVSSITQFLSYIVFLESGFCPVVKAMLYGPISKKNNKEIAGILKSSERFFRTIALIFVVYIILLVFIYPVIVDSQFDSFFTGSLIIIISISLFAEYYFGMTYRILLQADQKGYIVSIIQIITYILSIILVVISAKLGLSIQLIKLLSSLVFLLRPFLQSYYIRKKYNIIINKETDGVIIKNKWDGLSQHIASVVHTNTDITILTLFSSLSEVSVYSVYYLIIKGITQFIQIFTNGIDSLFGDMIAKGEKEKLLESFNIFEVLYFSIIAIVFSCSMILIVPFVSVYTTGINDVNYLRYTFGFLLVLAEYIWAVRQPYNELIKSAGLFKETKKGAWLECILNLFISIVLVFKFGIIGVAIGTGIAMFVRLCDFVYKSNKLILNNSIISSIKKIIILAIETSIVLVISRKIPYLGYFDYFSWVVNALITVAYSSAVIIIINSIFFRKELRKSLELLRSFLKRTK